MTIVRLSFLYSNMATHLQLMFLLNHTMDPQELTDIINKQPESLGRLISTDFEKLMLRRDTEKKSFFRVFI